MIWAHGLSGRVIEFNSNVIAVEVLDSGSSWTLVGFYAPPHSFKKKTA
jgi:hypothetical protein